MNIRTIQASVEGARQYVQDEKIQISRRTITKFQYADRWPDKYNSFVTAERRNNLYKDPDKFYRVMSASPKLYSKSFIFRPLSDVSKLLRDATLYANNIIQQQAAKFNYITGEYASSFRIQVDGRTATASDLERLNDKSVVRLLNIAPYAAWLEAYSLYYRASIAGVLYFAAQKVKAKYPQLGVNFNYWPADYVQGTTHYYAVPVLELGSRARVTDQLSKPGKNIRRRKRNSNPRAI